MVSMKHTGLMQIFRNVATSIAMGAAMLLLVTALQADAAEHIYYVSVSATAKDSNSGTGPKAPVRHLSKAITLAKNGGTIRISTGNHVVESAISIPGNVALEGGWDAGFEKQSTFTIRELSSLQPDEIKPLDPADHDSKNRFCESHTCIVAAKSTDRAITINASGSALRQLVLFGPDRSSARGSSSYGIVVDGVDTQLESVVVKAGSGGLGRDGEPGNKGSGYCSSGGSGGEFEYTKTGALVPFCDTKNHHGTQGETINAYDRTAEGGTGGTPGNSNCSIWPSINNVGTGETGGTGDAGFEGPPGEEADVDKGAFVRRDGFLHWFSAVHGGKGRAGSAGAGGGGGGLGGSWNVYYWCAAGFDVSGGDGHVGNPGGCGGGGGNGGYPGGGVFALVANDGIVHTSNLVLFGGTGGKGGNGGDGAVGSPGDTRDTPLGGSGSSTKGCFGAGPTSSGGRGGRGGHGGHGGAGGGGGGGNGGAAITIVKIGKGDVRHEDGVYIVGGGQPGGQGTGGHGAESKTVAPSGNIGAHAEEVTLELKKKQ